MRKTLILAALLAVTAATLVTAAGARPAASSERVRIERNGGSFVLAPTSPGAIGRDKGEFTACCWSTRHTVVAGQRLEVTDPHLTLTGANGTLKLHSRIEWVNVPGGWGVFTGTWKVVSGTGAYAGVSGHGSVEGVQTAGDYVRSQLFGFLTTK
jgi:hypothetical protein